MILEPVTGPRRRAASLPSTGRPTPRSVAPQYPSFQYPSFQFFKPDLSGSQCPDPKGLLWNAGSAHPAQPAPLFAPDPLPVPKPIPLTTPTFMPALPAMESNFEFVKSPAARRRNVTGNPKEENLRELERHVLDLVQGQEGLRKELQALKSQAAAQSRELDIIRQRAVGRPKLPPTRSPDTPLSFPSEERPLGQPRNVRMSAPGPPSMPADPAASMPSRSQQWDDSVADCLLCTR